MKILLADDHPMVRTALKLLLSRLFKESEIVEAHDYNEAILQCNNQNNLKLILLDLMMPGMGHKEGLQLIHEASNNAPVIILSAIEDPEMVWDSLDKGAKGYVPKSSSEEILQSAIQLVLSGGTYLPQTLLEHRHTATKTKKHLSKKALPAYLTKRQHEVLNLLVMGKSNKQIARDLSISCATVNAHVNTIFRSLQVNNRTEAVSVAIKHGLTSGLDD